MTDRITRIAIAGSTVWSAALANQLARAGVDVSFITRDSAVEWEWVSCVGFPGEDPARKIAKTPPDIFPHLQDRPPLRVHRRLDHFGPPSGCRYQDSDHRSPGSDQYAARGWWNRTASGSPGSTHTGWRRVATAHWARSRADRRLLLLTGTSDAASAAHVAAGFHPEDLDLITEVGWTDHGTDHAAWMLATGPGVMDGSAMILTSPSGVFVTLRNSMDAVNHACVETHEVIQGLIRSSCVRRNHPRHATRLHR